MSAAELKELRKEAKKYLDHVNENVVKMVHDFLEVEVENEKDIFQLTPEQEIILAERMKKYKKGLMKFSTWEEMEKRIVSRANNAI